METLNATIDLASATEPPLSTGNTTGRIAPETLVFFSAARYDFSTEPTVSTFLQQLQAASDEDAFGRGIVRSLPRSWRDL